MELYHLQCFYEVARAGSFTAAAKALHISQSALSKAVALLEDREGVTLFERSKKGVALTPLGGIVFDHCLVLFREVQNIDDQLRGATNKVEGHLRFGASDHLSRYILAKKIHQFRNQYPLVVPSLFVGAPNEIVDLILKNSLEFGLFFTKVKMANIEYKRIAPFEMVLVANAKLYAKMTAEDLGEVGIIGSISQEFQRHPSHRIFDMTGTKMKINIEVNNQDLQKRLCLEGNGASLLAKFMVVDELNKKKLRQIELPKPIMTDLFLAKRKGHVFTKAAENFIEQLLVALQSKDFTFDQD